MLTNPVIAQICQFIKDEILYGRLEEHERISERRIAERFSVSRTLVREAVILLKQEGFLYSKNKSGTYVSEPCAEMILENYNARLALEGDVLLMAFPNITAGDIAAMRKNCIDMLEAENAADYSKAEHRQHQLISARSNNRFVVEFMNSMMENMLRIGVKAGRSVDRRNECVSEWYRIISCIEQADPLAARNEFVRHIQNSLQAYETYYQKLTAAPTTHTTA